MKLLKFLARKILAKEIAQIEKDRDLYQSWAKHHQECIRLANLKKLSKEQLAQIEKEHKALVEIAKTCPLINADKDGMYNERAAKLLLSSTVRRMEIAAEALKGK